MARFIGFIQGNRGEASRLGTPASGIRVQAQGWNVGVKVFGDIEDGTDTFSIYATSGSDYRGLETYLGKVTLEDNEPVWHPAKGLQVEKITAADRRDA